MSAEDVAKEMMRIDKEFRDGREVGEPDRSINITGLYRRYDWGGAGPTPLSGPACKRLGISDRSADTRWMNYFNGHRSDLGIYRTQVGYYWLLRFDPAMGEHYLDHAGSAADVNERYGQK